MQMFISLLMLFWISGTSYSQDGAFIWVVSIEQGGKSTKQEIPARETRHFEDPSGANCIFSLVSDKKLGKQYRQFMAKLECKKGGVSQASEFPCLDSALNATQETIKISEPKPKGGLALDRVQIDGLTAEQKQKAQLKTASGLVMTPDQSGDFVTTETILRPAWDKNGNQRSSSSGGMINGVQNKILIECRKSL